MKTSEEKNDIAIYIDTLLMRFSPTDNEERATHKLSTKEVADAINELNPGSNCSTQNAYDALYEAGFVFRSPRGTSALQFKWLMIEK